MSEPLDLSIVIVNWNVRDLLRACLTSVREQMQTPRDRYEVVVVDNASHDGSVEMLRQHFPDVSLIVSETNLGFAGGCELGYSGSTARFVLLLNPDTVVLDHAIDRMLADMRAHTDVAVIGSRLENTDGSFQRASGGAFPSLANIAWNYLFLHRLLPRRWGPAAVFLDGDPPGLTQADWVSGAAMLLRREAIGPRIFDPSYFMFGEDMDLCDRVRRGGWKVLYSAHQSITHHHGQSFKAQSSMDVLSNVYKGPRQFFMRTHSRAALFVYDMILFLGYTARWIVYGLLSIARPKSAYAELSRFSRRYVGIMLHAGFNR